MNKHRDNLRKMNTVKRISRNSIALFSFSGRSKKRRDESNGGFNEEVKVAEPGLFVKSGSTHF